jgi:hypothetical protein
MSSAGNYLHKVEFRDADLEYDPRERTACGDRSVPWRSRFAAGRAMRLAAWPVTLEKSVRWG